MGKSIRLNGDDDLVLDIMNLMSLLKMSLRQAFTFSNTIWEVITVIYAKDDYVSD